MGQEGKDMTGYEFTRIDLDFTSRMKAQAYDAGTVAFQIEYNNPGVDLRADEDYKDAEHWFIETTMSCNEQEAIEWMKYYMANAIAYGIQTKNLDWRTKFLAAYDLFNHITTGRSAMSNKQARFLQTC